MTKELASLGHITVYGDMFMNLPPADVVLSPASSHATSEHLSMIGTLPISLQGSNQKLQVSLKSSKAQAGLEIASIHFDPEVLFVVLANCGPYWLNILSGDDKFDLGAIYSISGGESGKSDIFQFMNKLQKKNHWLTENNMDHVELNGKHYVWIETPTLIGPTVEPNRELPKVVNTIPRGTDRVNLGKFLDREVLCHRSSRKKPTHLISGTVPYTTTQTEYPVIPVNGMGMIIKGSAVLNKHGNVVSYLVHGASELVAQPDNTMAVGRSEHPIIAEFFTRPNDIVQQWKNGLRIGFFAQPVHLSVNS